MHCVRQLAKSAPTETYWRQRLPPRAVQKRSLANMRHNYRGASGTSVGTFGVCVGTFSFLSALSEEGNIVSATTSSVSPSVPRRGGGLHPSRDERRQRRPPLQPHANTVQRRRDADLSSKTPTAKFVPTGFSPYPGQHVLAEVVDGGVGGYAGGFVHKHHAGRFVHDLQNTITAAGVTNEHHRRSIHTTLPTNRQWNTYKHRNAHNGGQGTYAHSLRWSRLDYLHCGAIVRGGNDTRRVDYGRTLEEHYTENGTDAFTATSRPKG